MKIAAVAPDSGTDQYRITITYHSALDDPSGALTALVDTGVLGFLLREIGRHTEPAIAVDEAEYQQILAVYGGIFGILERRRPRVLLAGREQFGYSWRELGRRAAAPFASVKRWVTAERDSYARQGLRFSAEGLHRDARPALPAAAGARSSPAPVPGSPPTVRAK